MADITDLAQKLAFYRSGGKDEGQRDIDKIGKIFGTVKGGIDYRDEVIKRTLAEKKTQLENQKLQRGQSSLESLSPDLELPVGYGKLTSDEGKDAALIQSTLRKPEDLLGKEQRAEDRRIAAEGRSEERRLGFEARYQLRQLAAEDRAERRRIAGEARADERTRLKVDPMAKRNYDDLNNQIKLGDNLKAQLANAVSKGINVTGFLSMPINTLKETFGAMSKEDQRLITTLRLTFADFVRARGGTAFTDTEKKVFAPIMPEESKDEQTNLNRIQDMLDIMQDKKQNYHEDYPGLDKLNQGKNLEIKDDEKGSKTGKNVIDLSPYETALTQAGIKDAVSATAFIKLHMKKSQAEAESIVEKLLGQ